MADPDASVDLNSVPAANDIQNGTNRLKRALIEREIRDRSGPLSVLPPFSLLLSLPRQPQEVKYKF